MKPLNKKLLAAAQAAMPTAPPLYSNGNGNGHATPPPDADAIAAAVREQLSQKQKSPDFPLEALPKPIQSIIKCWVDCYLLPADYYASSILGAAAAVIGNAYRVEYKIYQEEPAMLWVCIVGAPGIGKTPAIKFAMQPLFDQEDEFQEKHDTNVKDWEKRKLANSQAKDKKKQPDEARPKRRQRIINDATIESLIKILPHNKRGNISYRDEIIGWFKSMNAYKSGGSDLEHWLSIWSSSPIMLNRVSSEDPVYIKSPFVSAIGGIQPGVLQNLTDGGKVDNGFVSRMLFAFPDNQDIPPETDITPDQSVFDHYRKIIRNLNDLPTNEDETPFKIRLSDEAKKRYREHKEAMRLICNATDEEATRSLYVKMLSYTLRFSLILELLELAATAEENYLKHLSIADMKKEAVSLASINRAITLSEYFTGTALKVMRRTESPIAALNAKNRALYESLPHVVTTTFAIEVGEKLGISISTVKRLLYNPNFFKQNAEGSYRKLFT